MRPRRAAAVAAAARITRPATAEPKPRPERERKVAAKSQDNVEMEELDEDVVQEIARLAAAMDLAIQAQPVRARPAGAKVALTWLPEEEQLLLALRRYDFGYRQIREVSHR